MFQKYEEKTHHLTILRIVRWPSRLKKKKKKTTCLPVRPDNLGSIPTAHMKGEPTPESCPQMPVVMCIQLLPLL